MINFVTVLTMPIAPKLGRLFRICDKLLWGREWRTCVTVGVYDSIAIQYDAICSSGVERYVVLRGVVLCGVVLCGVWCVVCGVLCCVVLCCAVLCCDVM